MPQRDRHPSVTSSGAHSGTAGFDDGHGQSMNVSTSGSIGPQPGELERRLAALGPAQRALLEQRLARAPLTGHRHVGTALARLGVTHLYGVPGQPVYDTLAACAHAGLRLIGARHQQPAALMAAAHNWMAGSVRAATVLSAGAAAANAVAAAVVARDNCWPLLLIAGSAARTAVGTGYFMSLRVAGLFGSVTKAAVCVADTGGIQAALDEAVRVAMDGRPGPVLVEVPGDVLTGLAPEVSLPAPAGRIGASAPLPASTLDLVKARLAGARRPLLVVGSGARWAGRTAELRALVDELAVPFIASPNARGTLPDDDRLCVNVVSGWAQSNADVVLMLGARLNWLFRHGEQFAPDATVIQVDVDAAETSRNGRVNIGVTADAGVFLRTLLRTFDDADRAQARAWRDADWVDTMERRSAVVRAREAKAAAGALPISPLRLASEIRDALPADAITVFDANLTMSACQQMIPAQLPVSRLTPGNSGCMGVGVPFAMAAKLASPSRPVVAVCGDFAVGQSIMELETAVRHHVPIVVVVANNDGNGGTLRQRAHFAATTAEPVATFQRGLRYDLVAKALGCHVEHVDQASGVGPAVRRALAAQRPACINVAVDPDAPFPRD
jgi:2-hydroxyacyl-CoA lyase 1